MAVPSPGQSRQMAASADHPVARLATSQVNFSPPPTAIAPMVSTTAMAEIRKKTVSSPASTRLSLPRSAAAAASQDGHAGASRAGGRACRRPARRNGRWYQGMVGWWWPVAMAATAATARSISVGVL